MADQPRPIPKPTDAYLRGGRCPRITPCHTGLVLRIRSQGRADGEVMPRPGSFLFEDAAEPDHVCHGAMHASLYYYGSYQSGIHRAFLDIAREHDVTESVQGRSALAVQHWAYTLPLPIGCDAIAKWRAGYGDEDGAAVAPPIPALSADPNAEAGLVICRKADDCVVRLFGLVEHRRTGVTFADAESMTLADTEEEASYAWTDPLLQVEGDTATGTEIAERLRRWYRRTLLGQRLPGRPPGTGAFASREDFLCKTAKAYQHVRDSGYKLTAERVARAIDDMGLCENVLMDPRTLRHWREKFGYPSFEDVKRDPTFRRFLDPTH
jgi:hypothetical protein